MPHGTGTLTDRDGGRYAGQFREGVSHGRGEVTYADGEHSGECEWRHGVSTAAPKDKKPNVNRLREDGAVVRMVPLWPEELIALMPRTVQSQVSGAQNGGACCDVEDCTRGFVGRGFADTITRLQTESGVRLAVKRAPRAALRQRMGPDTIGTGPYIWDPSEGTRAGNDKYDGSGSWISGDPRYWAWSGKQASAAPFMLWITGNKKQASASAAPLPRRVFRALAARLG